MTPEYIIIRYTSRHGEIKTVLVEHETFKTDCEGEAANAVPPGCTDIEVRGRVQILGDTDELDNCYVSDE